MKLQQRLKEHVRYVQFLIWLLQNDEGALWSWQPPSRDVSTTIIDNALLHGNDQTVTLARRIFREELEPSDPIKPTFALADLTQPEFAFRFDGQRSKKELAPARESSVWVIDNGWGTRMGPLAIEAGSKGLIPLAGDISDESSLRLWQLAARGARQVLDIQARVSGLDDFFAIVASDSIVFLTKNDEDRLEEHFARLASDNPAMIYADFPGRFATSRLTPLLDRKISAEADSTAGYKIREFWLLSNLGSISTYDVILIHNDLKELAFRILQHARFTMHQDFLWGPLFGWMARGCPVNLEIAIREFTVQVGKKEPVIGLPFPFKAWNVNTPSCLRRIQKCCQ
ncbi:MAG: hypothetical protein ABII72_02550 [Parcubacteria group bacterium]